ncbi:MULTISPECIES: ligase-associated DNA damage response exonuclease [Cyanophyceae]|uniref:ligase-associated DNA damage response exonuclease n=1 Tax=Cyanophyceae TaxID=3028117 RepID=UPI0016847C2A|nr:MULTISPECIES: ligase-associated DNA damage response exonuclease [Cyanophyceae]MBD1918593.1 ligase-associated DNA damage response exonuclease [Phormidium sp. FACHB-77]MBD2031264.1 ligase-associated DNA damage response exonuclease [Phormidium sp. FACHB-322]MBD2052331.1 ligase-associated DNA damage response exonuclease [Leptolyngbya sp. FACHB-60]
MTLITVRPEGLYCEKGDFYIDPWRGVETALITHAHSDHARSGSTQYIATAQSEGILRRRLGEDIQLQGVAYGAPIKLGETWVSFHSAGHVLGSAQIRVEHRDEVWVVSGDYKRGADPSCAPFEVVPCDTFITEATFGLPIYRWESGAETTRQIYDWWQGDPERPSILFCYAFGKAQRVLSELTQLTDRPVYVHGAIHVLTEIYREQGVAMVPTICTSEMPRTHTFTGDLVLAPPSGHRSSWMKRFKHPQTAFASGWMAVRGARRRRGYERGFVLSDHADWPGLIQTVKDTGAKTVYVTHGQSDVVSRYLQESLNLEAMPLKTLFEGEGDI